MDTKATLTKTTRLLPLVFSAMTLVLAGGALAQDEDMSFFITSAGIGNGAALSGLAGADMYCAVLAISIVSRPINNPD